MHESTKSFECEGHLDIVVDSDWGYLYLSGSGQFPVLILIEVFGWGDNWSNALTINDAHQTSQGNIEGFSIVSSFLSSIEKGFLPC